MVEALKKSNHLAFFPFYKTKIYYNNLLSS